MQPRRTWSGRSSLSEKGVEEEEEEEEEERRKQEDFEESFKEDFGAEESEEEETFSEKRSREELEELEELLSTDSLQDETLAAAVCEEQAGGSLSRGDTGQTGHMSPSLVQWGGFALPAILKCQTCMKTFLFK